MITKKERKKEKRPSDRTSFSHLLCPPPTFHLQLNTIPRFASGTNPSPTFPRSSLALMANPHQLPPGNTTSGRLSALPSPLPWRSGTPSIDQVIHFMARQLALARSALPLSTQDLPDFSPDTVSNTIPSESTMITLLSQLVQGLVTVSHELSGVTQAVATISQENESLREELHDISSP